MTRDDYRAAISRLEPDAALKERIAANLELTPCRKARPSMRRVLTGVLAAVIVLASLTGIAMAASPEIRRAVLSFFHIDEVERVPSGAEALGSEPLAGTKIGDRVTAWYIDMDFDGVFFPEKVRLNEDGSVDAFIDWVVDGGTLTAYEYAPEKVSFSVTWRSAEYLGDVYYCIHGGEVTAYDSRDVPWYAAGIPGRTDAVLLYCMREYGAYGDYFSYPFLLHLETGEVEDFLAGTGIEELDANSYMFSDDMNRVLVYSRADWDADTETGTKSTYYCELGKHKAVDVAELGGTGAESAAFAGDGTLVLSRSRQGRVTVWNYDPASGETKLVLDCVPEYSGSGSYGLLDSNCQYSVYIDAEGGADAIDLATGERRHIEGFSAAQGCCFMPNPSNTKLLYSGSGLNTLGVLDPVAGTFVSFDREPSDSASEDILSWYDDEYVMIGGTAADGGAVFYLYDVETGDAAQETPGKTAAGSIAGTDIGGRVTAWYLTLDSDEYSTFRNGACLDGDGNVESFVLCDFEGNELTITELEPERTEFSVTWRGIDYDCTASWCVRDGQALVRGEGRVPGMDAAWSFDAIPGRSDAALLYVSQGSLLDYRCYPYLCDLETGELMDILSGTGVNKLEFPYQYIFSDSMNRLFVTTHEPRRTYYCDIERDLLVPLDELVDRDALWGVFIDEDTAVITNSTPSETYSAWVLDLDSLAHRQTLSDAPANNGPGSAGTELLGGRYCIYTSQTGASTVIDLVTGEEKAIEGFVNRGRFLANGSRLLYLSADEEAEGLSIASLGVIDMSTGVFTAFDRSGYEDMKGVSVRWLDDERIMLESVTDNHKLHHLYIYEFK